jgi:hypothetical protein
MTNTPPQIATTRLSIYATSDKPIGQPGSCAKDWDLNNFPEKSSFAERKATLIFARRDGRGALPKSCNRLQ